MCLKRMHFQMNYFQHHRHSTISCSQFLKHLNNNLYYKILGRLIFPSSAILYQQKITINESITMALQIAKLLCTEKLYPKKLLGATGRCRAASMVSEAKVLGSNKLHLHVCALRELHMRGSVEV
jgi:hypothetical protein